MLFPADNSSSSMEIDGSNVLDSGEENEVEDNEELVGNEVEEPKLHMEFKSTNEIYEYYRKYGLQMGFGVSKRSSRRKQGVMIYFMVTCHKYGKPKKTSKDILKPHSVIKTDCKAKLFARLIDDQKWVVTCLELKHNHDVSPTKARLQRCNRYVPHHVKRKLYTDRVAGVPMKHSFKSITADYGGKEMPFLKKDCENYVGELRRLSLGEGDASALIAYFTKMQVIDSNFFYVLDLNKENRIRNVFWADARSRAACEDFGDVITFDTTYLTNKYDMPFAPFVGVNHHGQSILLGCGLISSEDIPTFEWLFKFWLTCMSMAAPEAIITDQCKAMRKAIENVFPNTRHRLCLWHIMMKVVVANGKILSPIKVRCKGRPPTKRKQSKAEQIMNKYIGKKRKAEGISEPSRKRTKNKVKSNGSLPVYRSLVPFETQESRNNNIDLNESIWSAEQLV